jgi:nitrate reductase NapE
MFALACAVGARPRPDGRTTTMNETSERPTKAQELRAFLLLAVVMVPVLAVMVVGGYGFLVWMFQLLAGPPGPRI